MECFWANEVNCWEPGCGVDPTNVIYSYGVNGVSYGTEQIILMSSDDGAIVASAVSSVEVDVYEFPIGTPTYVCGTGCPTDWPNYGTSFGRPDISACGSGPAVESPPRGAHLAHYSTPWTTTATVDELNALISPYDTFSKVCILTVHTDVGIFSYPAVSTAC